MGKWHWRVQCGCMRSMRRCPCVPSRWAVPRRPPERLLFGLRGRPISVVQGGRPVRSLPDKYDADHGGCGKHVPGLRHHHASHGLGGEEAPEGSCRKQGHRPLLDPLHEPSDCDEILRAQFAVAAVCAGLYRAARDCSRARLCRAVDGRPSV